MSADIFSSGVGNFWGIHGTRDYMRARFAAADALRQVKTVAAVEKALEHFTDMLRLCRSDNLGVRDFIPPLLLQLGREQECYDFLKWWVTVDPNYDWGNTGLPYLNIKDANVFEPLDWSQASFGHLVALTLLKLRLLLDFQAYETEFGFDCNGFEPDRPVGQLVKSKIWTFTEDKISTTIETLEDQYRQLCQAVNDANPYFWDALLDEAGEASVIPESYSVGSLEEAQFALQWCRQAWHETEDALVMIEEDTRQFIQPYQGANASTGPPGPGPRMATAELGPAHLERKRGNGRVFPFRIPDNTPTSALADMFPATGVSGGQTVRFIHREEPKKLLVYVDGACMNNGQPNPRGGWAVVYGPTNNASGRLEDKGPFGDDSLATSNRAELRAAIAALRLRDWAQDGFGSMVIATDSSYVVDGATAWTKGWVRNDWKTQSGRDVKNKDLWELLLGEVERWAAREFQVTLWKIPRELNVAADDLAKAAANTATAEPTIRDVVAAASQNAARLGGGAEDVRPRILTLCLDYGDMFNDIYGSLISQITSKATMERATKPEVAFSMLNADPAPSVILVTDGTVTRQQKLCERLIDLLRSGSTVILMGCFSSSVTMGQFNRFFARLGLPWHRGSYHREMVKLRGQVVGDRLASRLPSAYSQKALFVANVDRSAMWYTEKETSNEAAVVFANVGAGKLGYVGDVNGEEESEAVVLAMCGVLDR
jgi:ribonuclease HI